MGFFDRNQNIIPTDSAGDQSPVAETGSGSEKQHLNQAMDRLSSVQEGFIEACRERGLTSEQTTAAFSDAINAGMHPRALVYTRRDLARDLIIVHGQMPYGVVDFEEGDDYSPHPTEGGWPDQPDQNNPDAFYAEHYVVGIQRSRRSGPSYAFPDRQPLTPDDFGSLNARVEAMLPAADVQQ